jgi:hypothetical protein
MPAGEKEDNFFRNARRTRAAFPGEAVTRKWPCGPSVCFVSVFCFFLKVVGPRRSGYLARHILSVLYLSFQSIYTAVSKYRHLHCSSKQNKQTWWGLGRLCGEDADLEDMYHRVLRLPSLRRFGQIQQRHNVSSHVRCKHVLPAALPPAALLRGTSTAGKAIYSLPFMTSDCRCNRLI